MNIGRSREKLTALFALGVLLFNYPLLHLFGKDELIFGVPLLYLYLFGCWAAIIAVIAIVIERKSSVEKVGADSGRFGRS